MGKHHVRLPIAYQPGDFLAIFQGGFQFAVVDVQHLDFNPCSAGSFLHLFGSANRQLAACHPPMANVAVCHGDELHLVAGLGELDGGLVRDVQG